MAQVLALFSDLRQWERFPIRVHRMVNFRPASNFRISYTVMYHQYTNRMYRTDPEENERDGWFSRDFLQWGSHTMEPDFRITEMNKKTKGNNE